jgi:hypothetical protein
LEFLEAEMVLHVRHAVFARRRVDVEDEMVAAIPAHAANQGPALILGVVGVVITLRLDDEQVMLGAGFRAGRKHS